MTGPSRTKKKRQKTHSPIENEREKEWRGDGKKEIIHTESIYYTAGCELCESERGKKASTNRKFPINFFPIRAAYLLCWNQLSQRMRYNMILVKCAMLRFEMEERKEEEEIKGSSWRVRRIIFF